MDVAANLPSRSSEISNFALERINHFLDKPHLNTYRSLKELTEQVSSDYRSRVVVELIQNAHDAHSPDREDGKIALLLDQEEGEYGTLYVANAGKGSSRGISPPFAALQ